MFQSAQQRIKRETASWLLSNYQSLNENSKKYLGTLTLYNFERNLNFIHSFLMETSFSSFNFLPPVCTAVERKLMHRMNGSEEQLNTY